MKKALKIVNVIMLVVTILIVATTVVSAASETAAPDPSTYKGSDTASTTGITNIGNQIITIISTGGSIISVIVLIVLGIKYMMGSPEEKSEYKKTLLPYVIGAALVFAASAIAGIIFGFTNNLSGQL